MSGESNLNIRLPEVDLAALLDLHKKKIMLELNCHAVGKIRDFDSSTQTASALVNYKKTFAKRQSDGTYQKELKEYPILLDCPVISLKGNGNSCGLTMPIKPDDDCVVMFADRDIDNWYAGGNGSQLSTNRLHSLSDGIILCGVSRKNSVIENYDPDNPVLFNGETKITVKSDKVLIENSSDKLGALIRELIDEIKGLQTSDTIPNGNVILQPIPAASQALLEAVAVKLEGLLE